jgi:histidinol-phosphate aminotransferase
VEEVQRELGLDRVVKLASNEGQFGPFPEALEAIARGAPELNRYPDGGAYKLRRALAEKHGVEFENVAVAAGADAVVMYLSLAVLDPGDDIVCGWPSFPSYVLDAIKLGAEPKRVPLTDQRYDVERILGEVGPRTKLVYLCNPNNPTGTMISRAEVETYFERVPDHVLTVLDEAYFEYVVEDDYPDGIEEHFKAGRRVLVLRTFSKIYGLAGLRVGYGISSPDVVAAIGKVKNAFDINQTAQDAALASLGNEEEIARRRARTAAGRAQLAETCAELGLTVAAPAVANFVYVEVGEDSRPVFEALLREGVIVRPLGPFGAPGAIRVTVGTEEENTLFGAALERVLEAAKTAL